MKDLGPLHFFLDIEANFSSTDHLIQSKYIHDVLTRYSMLDCKPLSNLVSSSSRLSAYNKDASENPSLYRSVVGNL